MWAMIVFWFIAWLISAMPHVQVLPVGDMNAWGLTLIIAILLA